MPDQLLNPQSDDPEDEVGLGVPPPNAQQRMIQGMEASPDDAARAQELSDATGAHPALVHGDLENFEKQTKIGMASQLIRGNQHLQDYINSHPLGAAVSNDDWGQLDKISQAMNRWDPANPNLVGAAAKGFAEGFGTDEDWVANEELRDAQRLNEAHFQFQYPTTYNIGRAALAELGTPFQIASRTFSGILTAAHNTFVQAQLNAGADPQQAERRAREFTGVIEAELGGMSGRHGIHVPTEIVSKVAGAFDASRPWIEAGKSPPPLLHEAIADVAKETSKEEIKALGDLVKETDKSSTKARDPESFRKFSELKLGDATIGISAEKVKQLYGEAIPEPGDGKLGWVRDISAQYENALTSGTDIQVPLKDFLKETDAQVWKELEDGIRPHWNSYTLEEMKEPEPKAEKPAEEAPTETAPAQESKQEYPHEALERAVGLRPEYGAELRRLSDVERGPLEQVPFDVKQPEKLPEGITTIASGRLDEVLPKINFDELPEDAKLLSEFWGDRITENSGDTAFHYLRDEDFDKMFPQYRTAAGIYRANAIYIPERTVVGRPDWYSSQVILHEAGHAMSVQELAAHPELVQKVERLMDEAHELITEHNYAFTNPYEFFAEGVANPDFRRELGKIPLSPESAKLFNLKGTGTVWDAVRSILKDLWTNLFGKVPSDTVLDAFFQISEALEEANKELRGMGPGETFGAEPPKPMDELLAKSPFKNAKSIELVNDRLQKYLELIKRQQVEAEDFQKNQETLRAGAKSTKEWQDNYSRVREETRKDVLERPDVAADRFLRTGELPNGQRLEKVTIDSKRIPEDVKLPKEFVSGDGIDPDLLAPVFGYQSGDQLVRSIARLDGERELSGMTPASHLTQVINAETERVMQERYGRSAQDILDEMKEHVVSPTAEDLLHVELEALAGKPISRDAVKAQAKKVFDRTPLSTHSSDKYLAAMGREGQKAENALLDGNAAEALQAKQKQALLMHQAKLAMKLEKLQAQYERRAPRWLRREPPGTLPQDAVWIHDIMSKIKDYENQIGLQDLARRKSFYTDYTDLQSYVHEVNTVKGMYNTSPDTMSVSPVLVVPNFLFEPAYKQAIGDMLPPEFEAFFGALKSIDSYSRGEQKIEIGDAKKELKEVIEGLNQRLTEAGKPIKVAPGGRPATIQAKQRGVGAFMLSPETWMNLLDLGDRRGPFNQLIIRRVIEGSYEERRFDSKYATQLRDLGPLKDKNRKIENPGLFLETDGSPIPLTLENAYTVASNMGNELQRRKFLRGWGIAKDDEGLPQAEQRVMSWLKSVFGDEDPFPRAQALGKIFSNAFEETEKARAARGEVIPARIELGQVQTPWGLKDEFYHPLIPDSIRHDPGLKAADMNPFEDSGFYRPAPASGYTKTRTGAIYPIDLTYDQLPFKLAQILKDAAMRGPIQDVSKIVFDKSFQSHFKRYYGPEYYTSLVDWMKDLSGNRSWDAASLKVLWDGMAGLQRNMNTMLIGFRLGTVLKHGPTAAIFSVAEVGMKNFGAEFFRFAYDLPGAVEQWKFNKASSIELQNRLHDVAMTIQGTHRELYKQYDFAPALFKFRDAVQLYGAYPVGISDLISANVMWGAEYKRVIKEAIDKGETLSHGDAAYLADTAVRRTHGSSLLANKPGIMRITNPFVRSLMPFYNFFNNALQRAYESAALAKAQARGKTLSEMPGFDAKEFEANKSRAALSLIGGIMVYGVMTSLVEDGVEYLQTGQALPRPKGESDMKHWAKMLTRAYPSMIPGVRDIVNGLYSGHDPSVGLMGTLYHDVTHVLSEKSWTKDPGTVFRTANTIASLRGLSTDAIGAAGQFAFNVWAGKEHPKGWGDILRGGMRGTLKERR